MCIGTTNDDGDDDDESACEVGDSTRGKKSI